MPTGAIYDAHPCPDCGKETTRKRRCLACSTKIYEEHDARRRDYLSRQRQKKRVNVSDETRAKLRAKALEQYADPEKRERQRSASAAAQALRFGRPLPTVAPPDPTRRVHREGCAQPKTRLADRDPEIAARWAALSFTPDPARPKQAKRAIGRAYG